MHATVCQPGFGRRGPYGDEACERCERGTYSFGDTFDECVQCPFPKTTSFSGAASDKDCGESRQQWCLVAVAAAAVPPPRVQPGSSWGCSQELLAEAEARCS